MLDKKEAENRCFKLALGSASYAAALTSSISSNLYVFEFLVEDNHLDLLAPDISTGYPDNYYVCINSKSLNSHPFNVYGAPDLYAPILSLYYLTNLRTLWEMYMPDIVFTELEEYIMENAITPSLEMFQLSVDDFLSQSQLNLLHEQVIFSQARPSISNMLGVNERAADQVSHKTDTPTVETAITEQVCII